MARYKAVIEYDGTDFVGFQRQANGPTVQGALEAALAAITGGAAGAVLAAGRTDSGVHATGQVVAFDLAWAHGPEALMRALNANLPSTVAVKAVDECQPGFHPRYSAKGRRYRYTMYNAPVRSPLRERYAWRVWPKLNVDALAEASRRLPGRKDFAAFGSAPDEDGHTVREVREARWQSFDDGVMLDFYIEADAFLYRMVRSIVGTLKRVGEGELSPAEFGQIVESKDRRRAGPTAPPHGLCLIEVLY